MLQDRVTRIGRQRSTRAAGATRPLNPASTRANERRARARVMGARVVGLLLLSGLMGCGQQDTPRPAQEPRVYEGTIVAVGNSLTAGLGVAEEQAYPAQLQRKLWTQGYAFQVINAGSSGETSSGALARLPWTLKLTPDIVILETGANDGLRGLDPALTQQNITAIVRLLKAHHLTVILAGMQMVQNLGETYTTAFANIYPTVAREQGVILVPFFLAGVAAQPALNQADGIHPTADGYRIIVDTLYPYVIDAIHQWRQGQQQSGASQGVKDQHG
ncbi:hypothetical protein NKDENANG_03779 [Candidatus Entotheonellaceae bacterium PAL068K]